MVTPSGQPFGNEVRDRIADEFGTVLERRSQREAEFLVGCGGAAPHEALALVLEEFECGVGGLLAWVCPRHFLLYHRRPFQSLG